MGKNKDERIRAIHEEIKKLPKEMQKAMTWAVNHWGLVEWLCKESGMTNEEIEELKIEAIEKKDYLLLILVCAAQVFKNSDEPKKQ